MKKILLILFVITSCQVSDTTYKLPSEYVYIEEGGYANIVTRNNKEIISNGAFDYSYNNEYVMFVYDTTDYVNRPSKIKNQNLFYLVHTIHKNIISERMSYYEYKKFVYQTKIPKKYDLSIRDYSKYAKCKECE